MKKNKMILSLVALTFSMAMLGGCGETIVPPTTEPPTTEPPTVVVSTKEDVASYFTSTVNTTYTTLDTLSTVTDYLGVNRGFNELLDRQISVLANDLLYRLVVVYGAGVPTSYVTSSGANGENAYELQDPITESTLQFGGNKALISNYDIITNPTNYTSEYGPSYASSNREDYSQLTSLDSPYINELGGYAYSLLNGNWNESEIISHLTKFSRTNAISGGYIWNGSSFSNMFNTNYAWNWDYSGFSVTESSSSDYVYQQYKTEYLETFKLGIANTLSAGTYTNYSTALSNISKIGFSATDKTNIKNYILNTIIGSSVIATDNSNKPSENLITSSTTLTEDEHYYKAYSLLVPAMVDQAFNNMFLNTNQSIWEQTINRTYESFQSNIQSYSSSDNILDTLNYNSIKLNAISGTQVTKLVIKISGITTTNLSLKYDIYRNSNLTSKVAENISVSIPNSTSATVTLDFTQYKSNTFSTGGYIMLKFTNSTITPYTVALDGYYNTL